MHLAVAHGDINLCQHLIREYPQTLKYLDENKRSPLHVAAFYGHAAIIELLFQCTEAFDVATEPDFENYMPLYYAAQNNHLAACEALVTFTSVRTITDTYSTPAPSISLVKLVIMRSFCSFSSKELAFQISVLDLLLKVVDLRQSSYCSPI